MREFHRGPYETAVAPDEMLVEIRVALEDGSGSAYEKVGRRAGDWAVVAAGASLRIADGAIARAGVALAAAGGDITCAEAEAALVGRPPAEALFAQAAALAAVTGPAAPSIVTTKAAATAAIR
jgi:carbon-monoxide dehydrogenase medium subunit